VIVTAESVWACVGRIRAAAPLVHNITNYVVMNTTANALLALGASPVMAHAEEEVRDMTALAGALVINLGTLSRSWVQSAFLAAGAAREKGIPVVFDPVGAGATAYRTDTFRDLIRAFPPAIIRGNASEILSLAKVTSRTKGVDSTESSDRALDAARLLNGETGAAVCVSGETDYVVRNSRVIRVRNGHPMMPRVTGLGCTASALCGAFAAVEPDAAGAAAAAMAVLGMAGEMAAPGAPGPGTLQYRIIDALYGMGETEIRRLLKVEDGK
jgi:hydroxyethylthiazole kinase